MINLKFKKLVVVVAAVATLLSVGSTGASAAWKQDSKGWWNTEGRSYSIGWRSINHNWYYFGSNGYMKTGWAKDKGVWYYLQPTGAMKTGWAKDKGVWYYLQPTGAMKTGWVNNNGTWYYLQSTGVMKTGWVKYNDTWFYLQGTGAMKTGWVNTGGKWYFTDSNGAMQTGVVEVDGKIYSLSETGAMQTGNVVINGVTYTFDSSGSAIGDQKPTPTLVFTASGVKITPNDDTNTDTNTSQKTFQENINSKYLTNTQITLNDYNKDGVIKPTINFTPGTETVTIDGNECIVTKDIYVTLNGKDSGVSGDLASGYTITGTGTVSISAAISVFNKTEGKLYYVTSTPVTIVK